jgi:predicted SprT family Zn-dependent metalloprotease
MGAENFTERIRQIRKLAYELLARHRLNDWTFAFNRRKRSLGLCLYHLRTIELSVYLLMSGSSEEILDTILHEIAHALVGPEHGHDAVWKRKCLEIGARTVRCGEADMPIGRWRASCGQCGENFHRHRKPKNMRGWFCRTCGPEKGNLVWKQGA